MFAILKLVIKKNFPSIFFLIFRIFKGKCLCFLGYNGETCESMNCAGNNCSNHGKCNILKGKCACSKGFEGEFCEISAEIIAIHTPKNCERVLCGDNGVCNEKSGNEFFFSSIMKKLLFFF